MDPARFETAATPSALALPLVFTVIIGICVFIFRRTTLSNAIGRRLVGAFLSISIGIGIHRAILLMLPARSLEGVVGDLFVIAAVMIGIAIFVAPRAWASVAIMVTGAASLVIFPLYASLVFNASSVLATSVLLWALRAAADARSASSEAGRSFKNKTL